MGPAIKMTNDRKAQISMLEKSAKVLKTQRNDLRIRIEVVEASARKESQKAVADLKTEYDALTFEYEERCKQHAELKRNCRKRERQMQELVFQVEENNKNNKRMEELITKLQSQLKHYRSQKDKSEQQAKENLQKYKKAANDLLEAEERAEIAEASLAKMRT